MRLHGFALSLAALTLCCQPAFAHLMPAQNATMNIIGDSAFMVVTVPASALKGVDDDGNHRLSLTELTRHNTDITTQFNARFHVESEGTSGTPVLTWIMDPQTDGPKIDMSYVIVMQRINFAAAPSRPVVTTDLFGSNDGETMMTLTATRGAIAEVAILRAGEGSHTFFLGPLATFTHFVREGLSHILSGLDHLLFLLTLLVATAGWRYWLTTVTSFTIAHSISLALSALGIVRIAPAVVEPAIAASIVLVAVTNLWRAQQRKAEAAMRWRIAVVFACGLLHGIGFSSAIGAMAVDLGHRVATIGGFNLGIELGQLLFVMAVLAGSQAVGRLYRGHFRLHLPRLASITAAVAGSALLLMRL